MFAASTAMTLHWTFVLYSLYVEIAFACLLMLPVVSTYFARLLKWLQRTVLSNQYVVMVQWTVWAFYVALFLEAMRQVSIVAARNLAVAYGYAAAHRSASK